MVPVEEADVVASGSNHRWGVNAMYYGATLYELARSFWDGLEIRARPLQIKVNVNRNH